MTPVLQMFLSSIIDSSRSISYRNITIVNDSSRVVSVTPQLGASLTNDSRSIIYDRDMFIIQAMGLFVLGRPL